MVHGPYRQIELRKGQHEKRTEGLDAEGLEAFNMGELELGRKHSPMQCSVQTGSSNGAAGRDIPPFFSTR